MRAKDNNTGLIWKRRVARLLALFLVLYAFADMTVLQAYCGNEAVGIPSYARQLQLENQTSKKIQDPSDKKVVTTVSQSSQPEQAPDAPVSDEECFCCCSHTLHGFSPVETIKREISPATVFGSNFSDKSLLSDSHLPLLYQPPKFA